jgi:putative PIG3 family NAD(P)H quinone oxidoreductase
MSVPSEMIAVEIAAHGGPEVLTPRAMPVPAPGMGEVLIRVAAAGVNAPDLAQRRGTYPPPPGASPLPGLEVAGEIAALGPGAERFALGDMVVALTNGGGYAEYVAVPEGQVLPLPRGWSPVAGAALPETYFTIQQTLVMKAGLTAGQSVLVHGAAGGLGGAAIAIATAYGASAIGVVSSAEKAAYVRSLGATETIDRRHEDIVGRVKAITGGRGVDRVVDIVGGATLGVSLAAAAVEAQILVLATLSGAQAPINAGLIVGRRLTLHGSTLRPQPSAVKAAIAESLRANIWPKLESGSIVEPKIETFPLANAAAAHASMERPAHFGKTVLVTDFGRAVK